MNKLILDQGEVNKMVYRLVIQGLLENKVPLRLTADIQVEMCESDCFWVSSLDDVTYEIERCANGKGDYGRAYEMVEYAVREVSIKIESYYNNPWNFGPGYKKPVANFQVDGVRDSHIKQAIWKSFRVNLEK